MQRLLMSSLAVVLAACSASAPSDQSATAAASGYDLYGAGTSATSAVPVENVIADPTPYLGRPVKISGKITSTCSKKGCWMRLGNAADHVFVKFKDYGFFVPTSGVEGREAIVEGDLAVETQSVEELKHYLEDQGKSAEAAKITASKQVLRFMATGVAIEKPPR